jgi:hypothetical protein
LNQAGAARRLKEQGANELKSVERTLVNRSRLEITRNGNVHGLDWEGGLRGNARRSMHWNFLREIANGQSKFLISRK